MSPSRGNLTNTKYSNILHNMLSSDLAFTHIKYTDQTVKTDD